MNSIRQLIKLTKKNLAKIVIVLALTVMLFSSVVVYFL